MKKINQTKTKKQTIVRPPVQQSTNPSGAPVNPAIRESNNPTELALVAPPVSSSQAVAMIEAKLIAPTPSPRRKHRRHGRVACLPRVQRDMVNRMLWNGIPYRNIVAALDDAGFTLSEKNISNWATGGHLEWRLEQEAVIDNRLNQEHLLGFLRRDDAPELPEVGLQAAATRLSQVLLAKLDRADDPEANLDNYSRMVDLLCRLNREISATQKARDDSRRTLGPEHNPALVQDVEAVNAIRMERFYSNPPDDAELPKPAVSPLLPEIPTATFLQEQAEEERMEKEIERLKQTNAFIQKLLKPQTPPVSDAPRKVSDGNGN